VTNVEKNAAKRQRVGVAKSLGRFACGSAGLLHTQKSEVFQAEKPSCWKPSSSGK